MLVAGAEVRFALTGANHLVVLEAGVLVVQEQPLMEQPILAEAEAEAGTVMATDQ
jgi:hypothetical protein